jgi:hypothetical protein
MGLYDLSSVSPSASGDRRLQQDRSTTSRAHAPVAARELRHPQRARAEDRIRTTRATGRQPRHVALRSAATVLVTACGGSSFPNAAHLAF